EHFEAVQLRHLDVQEQEIRIVVGHGFHGLESVRALGGDLELFIRFEKLAKDVAGRRLVVDDDRTDHRGNSMATRNRPSASPASSRARPSETALSRPRAFCRPTPSPRASARSGSAGLSMRILSIPSSCVAAMSIDPPSTTEATPCRTAFSTNGWRSSGGTRQ